MVDASQVPNRAAVFRGETLAQAKMVYDSGVSSIACWARAEMCRARLLMFVADVRSAGIRDPLMVFKGVHLVFVHHAENRWLADADLVAPGQTFARVSNAVRAKWSVSVEGGASRAFVGNQYDGPTVDLQRSVLPLLFGTATWSRLLPECQKLSWAEELYAPSATDALVLALCHFVKDGLGVLGSHEVGKDVAILAPLVSSPIS